MSQSSNRDIPMSKEVLGAEKSENTKQNQILLDTIKSNPDWQGDVDSICDYCGWNKQDVLDLINLKKSPLDRRAKFKIKYLDLCEWIANH